MESIIYDLFQNFILGGLITASISYIGTYLDPLLGAIWWSFPISLIPTIYFMQQSGKKNSYISKFTYSTTYAIGLLVISCLFLGYYLKREDGIVYPILKSSVVWVICSIIFYYIVKHYKLEEKFM